MTQIGIDARLLHYRTGGISTYIRRLIYAIAQQQPTLDLTIFYSRKAQSHLETSFKHASLWTPAHHRLERLALSLELMSRHLHLWHSPDFIPPYRGAHRHVITVHDLTFWHYPDYLTADSRRYYNAQIQAACHHADAILAVSHATKQDITTLLGISPDKIWVQPHGVDESYQPLTPGVYYPILQTFGLNEGYFLHVGTLEPRKNIQGLLIAYHDLLNKVPDAPPIVLVGRLGWLFEQTEATIKSLNLGDKLIRLDNVSDAQLPALYNGACALITPSFYEGFGMPALEAMACGTVPIVSDVSSLPEVVGDVGLRIDPHDPQTITTALLRVLDDEAWRTKQIPLALARARQFTWEQSAQIALDAYKSIT